MTHSEAYIRSIALEKALQFHSNELPAPDADALVITAEKFRAFLAGGAPEPSKAEPERPTFELPRLWDGYTYFRFLNSPILYRSDTSVGSAAGGVDRLHPSYDPEWEPMIDNALSTRGGLRAADGYNEINPVTASNLIRKHKNGVRFE